MTASINLTTGFRPMSPHPSVTSGSFALTHCPQKGFDIEPCGLAYGSLHDDFYFAFKAAILVLELC